MNKHFFQGAIFGCAALATTGILSSRTSAQTDPVEFTQNIVNKIPGGGTVTGVFCTDGSIKITLQDDRWIMVGNDLGDDNANKFINVFHKADKFGQVDIGFQQINNDWVVMKGNLSQAHQKLLSRAADLITSHFGFNIKFPRRETVGENCKPGTQDFAAH